MPGDESAFFEAVINAGAILAGFCGSFLAFRLQREAGYYRQPILDFKLRMARDVYIGLTHFTSSFALIALASFSSLVFGFVIPLLGVAGKSGGIVSPQVVVGGLVGSVVLLLGYFIDEMIHYEILNTHLVNDISEWKKEARIVVAFVLAALAGGIAMGFLSR